MIIYKKSFNFNATDEELYKFVDEMVDIMVGDLDPKIEFDFESDENHRYVNFKILDKVLH